MYKANIVDRIIKLRKGNREVFMRKLFKNKYARITSIVCLISVIAIVVNMVFIMVKPTGDDDVLSNKPNAISNDMYATPSNMTKYQESLFKDLSELVKDYDFKAQAVDDQKNLDITSSLIKNFIADFYTWTNKSSTYSVGGQMFVYGDSVIPFQNHVRDTYYKDLDGYIAQYGRKNLPEVDNIEAATVFSGTYKIGDKEYTSYYGEAHWTYKESEVSTSGWQNGAIFHIIYNDAYNKFEIVQILDLAN